MPPDDIKKTIVAELNLGEVPEPKQGELAEAVAQNILGRLMLTIAEKLPDDAAREKFVLMAEAGDSAALKQYARTQIEGFDDLMAAEIKKEITAHKAAVNL